MMDPNQHQHYDPSQMMPHGMQQPQMVMPQGYAQAPPGMGQYDQMAGAGALVAMQPWCSTPTRAFIHGAVNHPVQERATWRAISETASMGVRPGSGD